LKKNHSKLAKYNHSPHYKSVEERIHNLWLSTKCKETLSSLNIWLSTKREDKVSSHLVELSIFFPQKLQNYTVNKHMVYNYTT
jgi:hypothetical protein